MYGELWYTLKHAAGALEVVSFPNKGCCHAIGQWGCWRASF